MHQAETAVGCRPVCFSRLSGGFYVRTEIEPTGKVTVCRRGCLGPMGAGQGSMEPAPMQCEALSSRRTAGLQAKQGPHPAKSSDVCTGVRLKSVTIDLLQALAVNSPEPKASRAGGGTALSSSSSGRYERSRHVGGGGRTACGLRTLWRGVGTSKVATDLGRPRLCFRRRFRAGVPAVRLRGASLDRFARRVRHGAGPVRYRGTFRMVGQGSDHQWASRRRCTRPGRRIFWCVATFRSVSSCPPRTSRLAAVTPKAPVTNQSDGKASIYFPGGRIRRQREAPQGT